MVVVCMLEVTVLILVLAILLLEMAVCGITATVPRVECVIHSVVVVIILHRITMGGLDGAVGVGAVTAGGVVAIVLIVGDYILIMAGAIGRMMSQLALSYWVPLWQHRVNRQQATPPPLW